MSIASRIKQVRGLLHRSGTRSLPEDLLVNAFHKVYYDGRQTWLSYHGYTIIKNPLDLWAYQTLLWDLRPDLVIETGTYEGASALWLAHQADVLGTTMRVVTIDVDGQPVRPKHQRIEYLTGSSIDPGVLTVVGHRASVADNVLVILDSDHSRDHVLSECRAYAQFVTPGSYLIVEDSNINNHPVRAASGPGPWEAIKIFTSENHDFAVDRAREPMLSMNPHGYLRRT